MTDTTTDTTPKDYSAKDFKDELLVTLGRLSQFTADRPIPFKATHDPVCTMKGVTLDQFGSDKIGRPWVGQWIGWAFTALEKDGLACRPLNAKGKRARGKWALTMTGVTASKALDVLDPSASATPTQTVLAPLDDDSAPKDDPVIGISVALGPGNGEGTYHSNPYIRTLAAKQTKCFGHFTSKSSLCASCPLSGPCRNKLALDLSALAAELAAEDRSAIAHKAVATRKANVAANAPAPPAPTTDVDTKGATQIIAFMDATCFKCGTTIPEGTECNWIKDGPNGGMFHTGC